MWKIQRETWNTFKYHKITRVAITHQFMLHSYNNEAMWHLPKYQKIGRWNKIQNNKKDSNIYK